MVFAPDEETLKQQIKEDKSGEMRKAYNRTKKERKKRGIPEQGLTRKQALTKRLKKQISDSTARLDKPISDIPNYYALDRLQDYGSQRLGNRLVNLLGGEGSEPIIDPRTGRVVGVTHGGLFGSQVYTGRPEFNPFAPPPRPERDRPEQEAVPPNPVTGQCPPGYTYDANAQACIPVFASQVPTSFNYEAYTPAQTLLDQPSGLLDVAPMFGQPMDFNYGMPRVRLI